VDHDGAERVAYFGDVLIGGRTRPGLSVYWHDRNRQWLVDLPGYAGGVARAEALRKFAEGALSALAAGSGEFEYTVFSDDYVSLELSTGIDVEDGPYLTIWAWFDSKRDFVGVSRSGEPLYQNPVGAAYLELYVDPMDPQHTVAALRNLLDRLSSAGESAHVSTPGPNVIATFTKPSSDAAKTRLDIARRPGDGQWLVTLYPRLKRPATGAAIQAFAEAARAVLDAREGKRTSCLIAERSYRLDVTVAFEADAFSVEAKVSSTGDDGTEYVLDADARFGPVSEAQLREMVTGLSH
jgi:hypothetical protein